MLLRSDYTRRLALCLLFSGLALGHPAHAAEPATA